MLILRDVVARRLISHFCQSGLLNCIYNLLSEARVSIRYRNRVFVQNETVYCRMTLSCRIVATTLEDIFAYIC